jgi:HEAT repeat protein
MIDSRYQYPETKQFPEHLPPVQPPSAAFLIQLFVVPGMIVGAIVLICLLLNNMLVGRGDPQELLAELSKGNAGSWQKAKDVAHLMHDPGNDALRNSPELATLLTTMLRDRLDEGSVRDDQVTQRIYLCIALGITNVDVGLPELLRAAATERDIVDVEVRKTAIESIARRIDHRLSLADQIQNDSSAMGILIDASQTRSDDKPKEILYGQLRYTAAYALGVIGGEQSRGALAAMLMDPLAAVRFNAATGLARHGDTRSARRLLEMLDIDTQIAHSNGMPVDSGTRTSMLVNGLRATFQLLRAVPEFDRRPELIAAVERVRQSDRVQTGVKTMIDEFHAQRSERGTTN